MNKLITQIYGISIFYWTNISISAILCDTRFYLNSTVNSIVWLTIVIFTLIAFSVFIFWVWLTLLSHQINKSRLATFGISIITSLIPVVFIGILVGMVMLATSR